MVILLIALFSSRFFNLLAPGTFHVPFPFFSENSSFTFSFEGIFWTYWYVWLEALLIVFLNVIIGGRESRLNVGFGYALGSAVILSFLNAISVKWLLLPLTLLFLDASNLISRAALLLAQIAWSMSIETFPIYQLVDVSRSVFFDTLDIRYLHPFLDISPRWVAALLVGGLFTWEPMRAMNLWNMMHASIVLNIILTQIMLTDGIFPYLIVHVLYSVLETILWRLLGVK